MIDARSQQAAAMFKPVTGGYVFRLPFLLALGGSRRFLVTEAQKAELLALLAPKRLLLWNSMIAGVVVGIVVVASLTVFALSPHPSPTAIDTVATAALTSALMAASLLVLRTWQMRRLAPLLARLPRTDLPFTLKEAQAAVADAMPMRQLKLVLACTALAAVMMLAGAVLPLMQGRSSGYVQLASGLVFVALTAYWTKRLLARRRADSVSG